jgi:hypothetical protein
MRILHLPWACPFFLYFYNIFLFSVRPLTFGRLSAFKALSLASTLKDPFKRDSALVGCLIRHCPIVNVERRAAITGRRRKSQGGLGK